MKDSKGLKHSTDGSRSGVVAVAEGARRATGEQATTPAKIGPLGPGERWTTSRKRVVVLRLLCGESIDAISRELGVEQFKLESWFNKVLAGMDASLRERVDDPVSIERDQALKRIGELSMENELLRHRCGVSRPFNFRRSKK
jgi:transposase-like protein